MQTDEQLMLQVKGGKVEMLAILFEKYNIKLYNFFLRLTGDKGSSEDMAQDVFFRILKYRSSYRGEHKFTTWMYSIARNVNIDRSKKNEDYPLDQKWTQEPANIRAPEEQKTIEQDHLLLDRALARLPLKKREVLVLSRYQGMKYKEIARLLDTSLENVKVLAHRAIKELQDSYLGLKGGTL